MEAVLAAIIGGALSFPHCLGMCGMFPLHLAKAPAGRAALLTQLSWHAGRIVTYVFLGSLAAFAGHALISARVFPQMQNVLAVVLGLFMVVMGLALMGLLPLRRRAGEGGEGLAAALVAPLFARPTPVGALALGLVTGFLPCPVVLGFLAFSANSGSVLTGMAVMAAMGLGTVWSLLILGLGGTMIRPRTLRWATVLGGVVLVLLGVATALRATDAFHRWLGCPPAADQRPPCPAHEASADPSGEPK